MSARKCRSSSLHAHTPVCTAFRVFEHIHGQGQCHSPSFLCFQLLSSQARPGEQVGVCWACSVPGRDPLYEGPRGLPDWPPLTREVLQGASGLGGC